MVGWMSRRMGSGPVMGARMWSDPAQMRETCQMWMGTRTDDATNAATWCGAMVDWMTQNRGSWDHGGMMDRGSMMGS
jgi:hypothetical protein